MSVIEARDYNHLRMELDSAFGELRELLDDVRHARIVEEHFASFPGSRVHGDVEGRQAILEDARDVALFHVRQRREVAVGERQPVVVVANVQRLPEALGESFDEAELAAVSASANGRRLEL